MAADVGVLLPLRIETRFRDGDLHLRVIPDEPWFARHDPRISPGELIALRRYVNSSPNLATTTAPPAWRELVAQVGAARAAFLHRRFTSRGPGGRPVIREPDTGEVRDEPMLPRVVGFPPTLTVYLAARDTPPRPVLTLNVKRERLLIDFATPDGEDTPDGEENTDGDETPDRRWWEDWQEAVEAGVAGIILGSELGEPIDALYVVGVGGANPADVFAGLAAEGRLGLIPPGTPTNTVDGAPAAPLDTDPDTWWRQLRARPGPVDTDVSAALTGNRDRLGVLPGGDQPHRSAMSDLITVLWPAAWGFTAGHVYNIARGPEPARWARQALYPEGPYPTLRVGPQPYGLLPTTVWRNWAAAPDDPTLEQPLLRGLLAVRGGHVAAARARGTVVGKSAPQLLELLAHTPTSSRFRYRPAWPMELWWLAAAGAGMPVRWREFSKLWDKAHPLPLTLNVDRIRRYGTRGEPRRITIPLVVPDGVDPTTVFPTLLRAVAASAVQKPSMFADTERVDVALEGRANSLLLRLVVRSLQLLIADVGRERRDIAGPDPELVLRPGRQPGTVEQLIAGVTTIDETNPSPAEQHLLGATAALTALADVPVDVIDRMLRAAVDTTAHRIDPWFVGIAYRRLTTLQTATGTRWRLGAYGWVDQLGPGVPGPTTGGLVHAPSPAQAVTAAVLRDRAVNATGDRRWDLDITSRRARTAHRIAEYVRAGADVREALGREVERIVATTPAVERLRRDFPVHPAHAGRRVCDGVKVLNQDTLPVPLSADQVAALDELRTAVDTYGDLLVADAVHHLSEGRTETAAAVMDAAAGLGRPPELAVLRTRRQGRSVATSVVMVLRHTATPPLPDEAVERAEVSPAAAVDASVAAFVDATVGRAVEWTFVVDRVDATGAPTGTTQELTLASLALRPVDAAGLNRTDLERLACEHVAVAAGLDATGFTVVGGTGGDRYEQTSRLLGLLGRSPAGPDIVAERDQPANIDDGPDGDDEPTGGVGDPVRTQLADRYVAARSIAAALVTELQTQLDLAENGQANQNRLGRLVAAARRWGIAPDIQLSTITDGTPATRPVLRRLAIARQAVEKLQQRLDRTPATEAQVQELSRDDLLTALVDLLSPTGQLAVTATLPAAALPPLVRARGDGTALDAQWLTVTAAVRPRLAEIEAHQLATDRPLVAWTNRPDDPWQTTATDQRRFVAVYTVRGLNLASPGPDTLYAVAAVDRFTEVVPAGEQFTGAAFGFDAPASRPPQAILLAVPPDVNTPWTADVLAEMLAETRELAHARMARPVDLTGQYWGLVPTALVPATGRTRTPLEQA